MITRRNALIAALGIPSLAQLQAASDEFWNKKNPQDWTPEEVKEMLNASPWAKPASISYNNKARDIFDIPYGGAVTGTSHNEPPSKTADAGFHGVVRWESANTIRAVAKGNAGDDIAHFYILALIGDFPSAGSSGGESEGRQQMLREFTKLERKGDSPIYLDHVEPLARGTLFFFSRIEPIRLSNKEITFTTKMGPLEIKAKFPLKEMMYRGKLDL